MASHWSSDVIVFVSICVTILVTVTARSQPRCHRGQFFDVPSSECKPCTECTNGQITKRTCHGHRDTECGFLKVFPFYVSQQKSHPKVSDRVPELTEPVTKKAELLTEGRMSDEEYWKTLSIALIGVLCAVSILLAIFVMVSCHMKKRRAVVEKEVVYETDYVSHEYAGLFANARASVYEPHEERYVKLPQLPVQPTVTMPLTADEMDDDVFETNTNVV